MARIDTLANFLTDIATAIKAKTGKTDSITPANFDTEINSIETGSGGVYAPRHISFRSYTGTELDYETQNIDTSNVTDMSYMFASANMTELDLSGFNVSNVTTMEYMFQNASNLTTIKTGNWTANNVAKLNYAFQNCSKLTNLDLSSCSFKSLWNMACMCQNCSVLETLNLSSINTAINSIERLGYNCRYLKTIDLSSLPMAYTCSSAFEYCTSLELLDMRSFDFSSISSRTRMFEGVPTDCEIIVKDDTQKEWFTTNYSTLTNVKTVAEYEGG